MIHSAWRQATGKRSVVREEYMYRSSKQASSREVLHSGHSQNYKMVPTKVTRFNACKPWNFHGNCLWRKNGRNTSVHKVSQPELGNSFVPLFPHDERCTRAVDGWISPGASYESQRQRQRQSGRNDHRDKSRRVYSVQSWNTLISILHLVPRQSFSRPVFLHSLNTINGWQGRFRYRWASSS